MPLRSFWNVWIGELRVCLEELLLLLTEAVMRLGGFTARTFLGGLFIDEDTPHTETAGWRRESTGNVPSIENAYIDVHIEHAVHT